eukprot:c8413_g1_i1.p1 GENE.c8413_g1_i1~~c8413_g1_i1.p1  ORF type:complete len:300 (+),score=42.74 c8413_g1_i1:143-1042(+)
MAASVFVEATMVPVPPPEDLAGFVSRFSVSLWSATIFVIAFWVLRSGGLAALLFGQRYRSLDMVDQARWNERLLAVIHAVIAAQGSLRSVYRTFQEVGLGTPELHHVIVATGHVAHRDFYVQIAIGYFISDLIIYAMPPNRHGVADYLHHLTAVFSYGVGVYFSWASFVQISFLQNEVSTPLYHLTWFLRIYDMRLGVIDLAARALFAALFFASRLVWNCFVCYLMIEALRVEPIPVPMWAFPFQLTTLALHVGLQFFWFYYIVAIFAATVKAVREGKPPVTAVEDTIIGVASKKGKSE